MTTTDTGRRAESAAAVWLSQQGFKILARNWRTRYCEIDLVTQKDGRFHFVEVKYRRSSDFGSGFDYIGPAKQRQLARAAAMWIATHAPAADYQIDAIQVLGQLEEPRLDYLANIVQ